MYFAKQFDFGVACQVKIDVGRFGGNPTIQVKWQGKPISTMMDQYQAWMFSNCQKFVDEHRVTLLYVMCKPECYEAWEFVHSMPPKHLSTMPIHKPNSPFVIGEGCKHDHGKDVNRDVPTPIFGS